MSQLQAEIQQAKPFDSLQEELWLNLSRTAAVVSHDVEQRFRPYGVSTTQYNVLRILRGAGSAGLVQYEVGERLVAQVPDVPRILGRMEKAGWVARVRGDSDKRVVRATLTERGRMLLEEMEEMMRRMHTELFPHLRDEQMRGLCDLLTAARSRFEGSARETEKKAHPVVDVKTT